MRASAALLALALGACAINEGQYPLSWDPLYPPTATRCEHFAGSYADRGEAPQSRVTPSLSYGLFGEHSAWEKAQRVELAFPADDELRITVHDAAKPLFSRTLSAKAGDFVCQEGRLVVRSRRWFKGDVMAGREHVTIELHDTGAQLVARVEERAYGTIFALVPIAGTAVHWYRFPRLAR